MSACGHPEDPHSDTTTGIMIGNRRSTAFANECKERVIGFLKMGRVKQATDGTPMV